MPKPTQPETSAILRHVLTTAGGVLISKGMADSDTVDAVAGLLAAALSLAWSLLSKRLAAKTLQEAQSK